MWHDYLVNSTIFHLFRSLNQIHEAAEGCLQPETDSLSAEGKVAVKANP